jgi:15-cis-phytoene synthase
MQGFWRLSDPLILPLVAADRRAVVDLLWQLDARLGEMARAGKEPALRLIRLKWWQEQLSALTPAATPPEPLLAQIAPMLCPHLAGARLAELAEAWAIEAEDADAPGPVERGALLFRLSAEIMGAAPNIGTDKAGSAWSAVDGLIARGDDAADTRQWSPAAAAFDGITLSMLPRPLACLTGVARGIAQRRGARSAIGEQWTVFRIGVFGR